MGWHVEAFSSSRHPLDMCQSWCSKWPHLEMPSCCRISKHPPKFPHFAHMSTKLLPTKAPKSHAHEWSDHEPTCPLQVQQHRHMYSAIPQNGHTTSCCIYWNSFSAFCPHISHTCQPSFPHDNIRLLDILLKTTWTWQWLTRLITGITSSPCTNKYHLESDQSDSLIPQYFWGERLGSVAIFKNLQIFLFGED